MGGLLRSPILFFQNPKAEEGEVVFHRILWVELAKAFRKLDHGLPVSLLSFQQTKPPGDALYMHVKRHKQLGRFYIFPNAEVNAPSVISHHPAQEHVQALAGGFGSWRCHVLPGTPGRIGQGEKEAVETSHSVFYVRIGWQHIFQKSIFQGVVVFIEPLQKFQKIKGIRGLESAVFEREETLPVFFQVVQHKIIGRALHKPEQFVGFADDRPALAPGKHGRPESSNLYVL